MREHFLVNIFKKIIIIIIIDVSIICQVFGSQTRTTWGTQPVTYRKLFMISLRIYRCIYNQFFSVAPSKVPEWDEQRLRKNDWTQQRQWLCARKGIFGLLLTCQQFRLACMYKSFFSSFYHIHCCPYWKRMQVRLVIQRHLWSRLHRSPSEVRRSLSGIQFALSDLPAADTVRD